MNMGGAENFIMNVYRKIDRSRIQFDFAVHDSRSGFFDDEIRALGGEIFCFPRFKGLNFIAYKKAWKSFLKNSRHYAVHAHMQSTASIYLKIARKHNIKTICHSHTTSYGKGVKSIGKRLLQKNIGKFADIKLACGHAAGEWLYGKQSDFTVVKNGIDSQRFLFCGAVREKKREELGLGGKLVIGHAGRFDRAKNQSFLIDVFADYQKLNRESALLLIGDGESRKSLEERVRRMGLADYVKFLGIRKDVNELFMAMDCFVFPSVFEGLPLTLVEAQASGLPCVVSDAVSAESKITESVVFESLKSPLSVWSGRIEKSRDDTRAAKNQQVKEHGFDVQSVADGLSELYAAVRHG